MPHWNSTPAIKNSYWESLSGIHTFTLVLAFLELFNKLGIMAVVFFEFKKANPNDISELLKFSYVYPSGLSNFIILYIF